MKCERCKEREATGMWNPENLGGHEIVVCTPCWRALDAELEQWEADEQARYLAQHPYDGAA